MCIDRNHACWRGKACGTIVHQRSGRGEDLASGTVVDVAGVIISEVLAREDPICARRLVEHRNVRLDPVLVNQPAKHLGRAIAAVADESARIGIESFERAFNHAFGGQHLGLPGSPWSPRHRNDDRVLDIDQVVRRLGEEGLATIRPRPAQQVIGRDMPFDRELIEQCSLFDLPMPHHDLQSCQLETLNH